VELSREARVRLVWIDFYRCNRNAARTCSHFGISRQTFYRWQRRYDPFDLSTWNLARIVPIANATVNGEKIYNTVRPHQALGYLTAQQCLRQISSPRKE
jgi:transposase InsO family protein